MWADRASYSTGEIMFTSVRVVKVSEDWCRESGGQWVWFPGQSVVFGCLALVTLELEGMGNRFVVGPCLVDAF